MTVWTELQTMSDEALGRRVVSLIGLVGGALCLLAALAAAHPGLKYFLALGVGAFLLTALFPGGFAPRFGKFLAAGVTVIAFMGVGGGIRGDVSPLVWLVILPAWAFAVLLAFPGTAVWLFRSMIGAGR